MNQEKYMIQSIVIVALLLSLVGCSESIVESTNSIDQDQNNVEVAATFTEIQENILNNSCAFSGCHSSGSVNPDLSGNAFARIVNQSSSTGMNYITPNNPNESYLLQKIIGGSSISGSVMPLNSSALSQEQIKALTDWINDGAKNN